MEEGKKGMVEAANESRMEPLLPPEVVEAASINDMSSVSWRLNLREFPELPERKDGDHSSFILRRLIRAPSKPCLFTNPLCVFMYNIMCKKVFDFVYISI
jgi:hypothetical protein